ncbi:predicted protein [Naegleria gruberi]|uniref:Predicted protein n=1 Tax=Naegleria gruberi TaxID=5762 RepID=D2V4K2_NAEGR|nr:uncharacterized protein NAEGRDRAFT_63759 [Naegleria gruberi]EFC48401.1 predicted protein [Naegleria gruberi]|eukprot:XP_002681145.1 predicted protein [Naegleria gruberi strain NEG-M]
MDSTTQQLPEQSPLSLPDVTTKKKIFHLVNNILLLAFCVILFLYHIIAGLIWFISGMLGYGMSDLFMFFLNFFTLSIGITGVVSLARENMNIAYRYTLLRFNVGSAMIGLPFLSVCYLFISLTEYAHSVNNNYVFGIYNSPGLNYAHCTIALIWSIVSCALAISSSISGFMYYQYFDEFRLEKSKQELIQSCQQKSLTTSTSVIVQQ